MPKWKLQLSTTEPNNDVGLIKINQDDENSQTFEAEISEFGQLKDFSNREVYFNAKIGPYKVRDKVPLESIYYDSNRVAYTLIAPFLQKIGEFEAWFSFRVPGEDVDEFSTTFFSYRIVPGITKDIKEGNYLWDMEELLRYYKRYKDLIAEIVNNKDLSSLVEEIVNLNDRTNKLDNYPTASKADAEEGKASNRFMTPERTKQFYLNQTKKRRQKWDEGLNWIAHRGNNAVYPENSLMAFKSVTRHWGIETDIQVTSDGKWVVMHDDTVDRTTNGTGKVRDLSYAQFRNLRIDSGSNVGNLPDGERIPPSFEEYLLICKQLNKVPIIEIKTGTYSSDQYASLRNSLNLFGYDESNCVIGSFDFSILSMIRVMYPEMELHHFVNSINLNEINQLVALGVPAVCSSDYSHFSLNAENIRLLHAAGLKVAAWTVPYNDFDRIKELGVDYITTNSKSGNLRYAELSLKSGFKVYTGAGFQNANYVEEISPGNVRCYFNVIEGNNTTDLEIATLPNWATPFFNEWKMCNVRTETGTALATANVMRDGKILVGLGWSARTVWALGTLEWSIH